MCQTSLSSSDSATSNLLVTSPTQNDILIIHIPECVSVITSVINSNGMLKNWTYQDQVNLFL